MSLIQTTNIASHASASNLFDQATAAQAASSGGKLIAQEADGSAQFSTNATNVSISPEAKAAMERAEADKAAADQLSEAVQAGKPTGPTDFTFDEIFDMHGKFLAEEDAARETPVEGISAEKRAAMLKEMTQAFMIGIVERRNPEGAQALREAFTNGTVQVHKASNVPGVELNTVIDIKESWGGTDINKSYNPNHSADIQAEIDNGRAYAMNIRGVGDVYLTW